MKPDEAFKKAFPQFKVDSITESQIPGIYEVVTQGNILFYYPAKDFLIAGDIYNKDGESIVADKRQVLIEKARQEQLKQVNTLPLEKALKVGNGPITMIEFSDPDCPFCRKADKELANRTDITRYIFFSPIAHPNAITKVQYILGAKDRKQAYADMMAGKPIPSTATAPSQEIIDLAAAHLELAKSLGIEGTPTFFINGQEVIGADMDRINALLKEALPPNLK